MISVVSHGGKLLTKQHILALQTVFARYRGGLTGLSFNSVVASSVNYVNSLHN